MCCCSFSRKQNWIFGSKIDRRSIKSEFNSHSFDSFRIVFIVDDIIHKKHNYVDQVFSYNKIGDWGARSIAEALKVNSTLKELWLQRQVSKRIGCFFHFFVLLNNQIGDIGHRILRKSKRDDCTIYIANIGMGTFAL